MKKKTTTPPKTIPSTRSDRPDVLLGGQALRQQAEAKLKKNKKGKVSLPGTEMDTLRYVQELEVHQIELEMMNEELLHSRSEVDALLDQFTDLYNFAPVGYFTLARDGGIKQANLTGAALLGVERGKLVKRRFGFFVSPASRLAFSDFLEKVFSTGAENQTCEVELLKRKTESLWVSIEAAADNSRETCRAIVVDITARKQAEEEIKQLNATLEQRVKERTRELRDAQKKLVRQEKLAVLGQMSASVGHELRNPLAVISNAVYFLKMVQSDAPDQVKEYLNLIQKNVYISDKIVGDLLDFTRVKSVARELISIPDLVRQTLERFPAPENVQVEIDLPADLPQVYADSQQVIQVLGNLTLNAYQAMLKGGQLTFSSRIQDGLICIAVQDSGSGISPENMEKIFEPLFTTRTKGIGLGLAVSKKLIEANGGRIEVESDGVPGKGSAFTVYLPLSGSGS